MKRLLKKVGVTWQISFLTFQIYFLTGQIYFLTFQISFLTFQKYHRRSYLIEGLYDDLLDWLRIHWSFASWKQQISKVELCFLRIEMSLLHCSTSIFLSNIKLYHLSFLLTQVWCELLSEKFQYFHQKWFTKSVEDDGDYSLHEEGGGWKPYLNTSDQQFSGGLNLNEPALSSPSLVFWWSDKSSAYEK